MFDANQKDRMKEVVASMAQTPLRCIAFAFTEMDVEEWLAIEGRSGDSPE